MPLFPYQYEQRQFYQGFPQPPYYNPYGNSFANRSSYQPNATPAQASRPNPALPPARQPLQITAGNQGGSSGFMNQSSNRPNPQAGDNNAGFGRPSNRPNGGFQNRDRRFPRPGIAYQTNEVSENASNGASTADQSPSQDQQNASFDSDPGYANNDNYYGDEDLDYYEPQQDADADNFFGAASVVALVTFATSAKKHKCRHCLQKFPSKNMLHKHLGNSGKGRRTVASSCSGFPAPASAPSGTEEISEQPKRTPTAQAFPATVTDFPEELFIQSTADSAKEVGTGHAFRNYHYAMADAKLWPEGPIFKPCLDTGCSVALLDREEARSVPSLELRKMASPIKVRGVGSDVHETADYVITSLYFLGNKDGQDVTYITAPREVHLVDKLKAKMLIGMDFLVPEKIDILASKSIAKVGDSGVEIPIEVRTRGHPVTHPIHAKRAVVVPPYSQVQISVHYSPLPDRDFFFEPDQLELSLYTHLVDANLSTIIAKNDSDAPVKIPRNLRLGTVREADFDNCFHITSGRSDIAELATRRPKKEHQTSWIKRVFNKVVTASAIAMLAAPAATAAHPSALAADSTPPIPTEISVTPTLHDSVLPNGVTIYGNNPAIESVVKNFPSLWQEGGFADVPENEWMRIPLKSDWEERVPKTARVYPLSSKSKKVVDATFDKLHNQGRLSWTSESTPFSFPVFVVWKTLPDGTRKGRAVVDIRGLNAVTQTDVYPLPLQVDMVSSVKDCHYISVVDCTSFFYQWRVHPDDRHRLTVVSHRGQETFNVAVMGYKNSPAYVQRQIDRLLYRFRSFAKAYIDDVVIFSKTLAEHIQHLRSVFKLFVDSGISVNPNKAFLAYPSVQLLGQKVDSLGL